MKSKKILMASLVPFWHRQTGAQQRIFALVQALQSNGHQVKTFFPLPGFARDQDLIKQHALDVEQPTSDQPPEGTVPKVAWYFRAVVNQLKNHGQTQPLEDEQSSKETAPMKLDDYVWPWAGVAFEQTVNRYQPDIIICQYVTSAWLLDGMSSSQRSHVHAIIDTHDLLSDRKDQFEKRGHGHWIDISKEEESLVLAKFDTVLAIQDAEAALMREMAPKTRVIVAGHHAGDCEIVQPKKSADSSEAKLSLGYIASVNDSNIDAIESFLEQVWPRIGDSAEVELVVAGAICEKIASRVDQLNLKTAGRVRLLGSVENLIDFYREIDVAINPVQFGTGLKIKTAEALSHGIPVLTTEPKMAAHEDAQSTAVVYCGSLAELADKVEWLLTDGGHPLERLKSSAIEIANQGGQAVYQELLTVIAEA